MITILKIPKTKKVKLFKCSCGCEFTAEPDDYSYCESGYYLIKCPFCHNMHMHRNSKVKEIEIEIKG